MPTARRWPSSSRLASSRDEHARHAGQVRPDLRRKARLRRERERALLLVVAQLDQERPAGREQLPRRAQQPARAVVTEVKLPAAGGCAAFKLA